MVAPFNKKPAFSLYVALLAMTTTYMALAGRHLLLLRSETHQLQPQKASAAASSLTAATTSLQKDSFVAENPTSAIHNVTETLERLFDRYTLEINDDRFKKRSKSPAHGPRIDSNLPVPVGTARLNSSSSNISYYIDETTWQVKAPIHDQLDFAVIGHAKTGTTFIQSTWWSGHPEIHMPSKECRLMPQQGGAAKVVQLMHTLRQGQNSSVPAALYGYKNPQDINRPRSLVHIRDYFPHTKLVVGLRHPVWWFQSFYNHRIKRGGTLPPAETLIGACSPDNMDVCTDNANFHANLANLGLTKRSSQREKQLLSTKLEPRRALRPGLPNPIFLYEQVQLDVGRDAQAAEALRQDLSDFLDLHTPLPPLTRTYQPGLPHFSICEDKYEALRQELIRIGEAAGTWIKEFFLDQPTVHVSAREEFEALIGDWAKDPCV